LNKMNKLFDKVWCLDKLDKAALKLTAFYVLGAVVVSSGVTLAVYRIFFAVLRDSIEYKLVALNYGLTAGQEFVAAAGRELLRILLATDLFLVTAAALLGYWSAKLTLRPIRENMLRQKQFIANAAHELKTPVAIMKTGLDTLPTDRPLTAEELAELKKDLSEEVDALNDLIDNLLLLDKFATEEVVEVDFSLLCSTEVNKFKKYAKDKNINLNFNIEKGIKVRMSLVGAKAVVRNLIKNALDYTKPDGRVEVSLCRFEDRALFTVKDTGIGIPAKDRPYVFERFFKASNAKSFSTGSGLGLAIVAVVVEESKGKIRVESEEGKGTLITVELPVAA